MTTVAPEPTLWLVGTIVSSPIFPSAVLSGIVPDRPHLEDGGYHCSIDDLVRFGNGRDYSNVRPLDQSPPVTVQGRRLSAAHDISLGKADMIKLHRNVRAVWLNRANDTRAKYVNAINCWPGSGSPIRYNFQKGTAEPANLSHTWHEHTDQPRVFVDVAYSLAGAWRAARAVWSMISGQTHDAWLRQEKLGPYAPKPPAPKPPPAANPPAPVTPEDDDMITDNHRVPDLFGYAPDGTALPEPTGQLTIGLPPAGHPEHRWGKDWQKPYLSLAADGTPPGTRVRIAIHDGTKLHVSLVTVKAGARQAVTVPPPATQAAYVVTVGRVQPANATGEAPPVEGAEPEQPAGTISLMVELLRK